MDKAIEKSSKIAEEIKNENSFGGYTIEELRYQRAVVALQKEFAKAKVVNNLSKVKKTNPLSGSKSGLVKAGGMASRIISGLNVVDYAMLGFSVFSTTRKFFSFFRRKK